MNNSSSTSLSGATRSAATRRKRLRSLAFDLAPPMAFKAISQLKRKLKGWPVEWQVLPGGFEEARRDAKIKGWNEQAVMDVYANELQTMRERLDAGIPIGLRELDANARFDEVFNHNLAQTWGWVLGRAAGQSAELSVLDWGGALGHYYVWARALRPDLKLDYTVKEMPIFAEQGAQLLPEVRFCGDAQQALARQYDLVFASGSLHYEEDWHVLLAQLLEVAQKFVFLTRVPMTTGPAFVYVQRPYAYGYDTEYPSWCINRDEFLSEVEKCGWQVDREVVTGERVEIVGAPEVVQYRGYLLRPLDSSPGASIASR